MLEPWRCLSVRQPWAWSLCAGYKPVENRSWPTKRRGIVLVHAGAKEEKRDLDFVLSTIASTEVPIDNSTSYAALEDAYLGSRALGAIVGAIRIVDCVTDLDSPWFFGPYGFLIDRAMLLPEPVPCRGALGFFQPLPGVIRASTLAAIKERLNG